jgi:dihydrolipoamide dehydrogenase
MAQTASYDVIVVGAGPGGYVAAVKAAQLGLKTACIEKDERLGGVCLNVGCIPSKALLDSSEYFHLAKTTFSTHGIKLGKVALDLAAMMKRKDEVVQELTGHVQQLLESNKVAIVKGTARLTGQGTVEVTGAKGTEQLTAKSIILATGSAPVAIPGLSFDGDKVVTSTGALSFDAVPKRFGVIGGGFIGLEMGSVWNRLGSDVTVIEMLPKIGSLLDGQVARTLDRLLRKQGFEILTDTKVMGAETSGKTVNVKVKHGDEENTLSFDKLLVSVGRRPLTQGLGLDELGIAMDKRTGCIQVNERYETSVPGIYAIGDLIPGPMLAHKAMAEGIAAAECIAGLPGEVNYDSIPSIIYTAPEVASVGMTEEAAREREIPCCIGVYPFSGAGRARCIGEKDGFVKLISHSKTDRILGVHIIGPRASDIIAECGLAMTFGASAEDIARTVHGHPTFAEALQEAAMAAQKCSIYHA